MTHGDVNIFDFLNSLLSGGLDKTFDCPDGLIDLSELINPLREIRLDPSRARTTNVGGVGNLCGLILDAAMRAPGKRGFRAETVLILVVIYFAQMFRVLHEEFGISPEEMTLAMLKAERLDQLTEDLSTVPVTLDSEGDPNICWNEIRVFAQPLDLEVHHLRGFAKRQLGIRTFNLDYLNQFFERLDVSELEDTDFVDASEVEFDPEERDELSWLDDIIDQAMDHIDSEGSEEDDSDQ